MLAFDCSEAIADRGLRMHHQNPYHKVGRALVIIIPMLLALSVGGMRANAQSIDDASTADVQSSVDEGDMTTTEPARGDAPEVSPASDEGTSANPIDDAAGTPVTKNVEVGSDVPGTGSSDEASGSDYQDSAVLELPQIVNLQNGNGGDEQADGAIASGPANDDDAAQSGPSGQDTAVADSLPPSADQVGTLADYQNQMNQAPRGPIFYAPGLAVVRLPRPLFFNPPSRRFLGAPMVTAPVILPPTSSGPFPSTSPMLMGPRIGTLGSFPRGGLMRFRR
jgi:hypothetical protein